jgi:hypothetical protein
MHARPTLPRLPRFAGFGLLSLTLVGLSACASSSTYSAPSATRSTVSAGSESMIEIFNEPGTGERIVEANLDDVWLALPVAYSRLDIPISVSDPGRHAYGNAGYRASRIEGKRLSEYFNCGTGMTGPLADDYNVTVSVVSELSASPDGTRILTTVSGEGKPRSTSGNTVRCSSRGVIEMRVGQLVADVLAGGR